MASLSSLFTTSKRFVADVNLDCNDWTLLCSSDMHSASSELDPPSACSAAVGSEELASAAQETAVQVTSLKELVGQFKIKGGEQLTSRHATPTPAARPNKASSATSGGAHSSTSAFDDPK